MLSAPTGRQRSRPTRHRTCFMSHRQLNIATDNDIVYSPSFQQRDVAEGADIIMVKPALPYLDVIQDAAELARDHPLACYQVSGEFAMIHAGAKAGVYDLRTMAFETSESLVRAGACATVL